VSQARTTNTDYLLDTSVLSRLLDTSHTDHAKVKEWEAALSTQSRKLLSVVAIAELRFGLALAKAANRHTVLAHLEQIIRSAELYTPLGITNTTANEYAMLKSSVVAKYLPKRLQQRSNKGWGNPEDWIDEFTGRALKTQENDLWQCAQAIERELTFVSCDGGAKSIQLASPDKLTLICLHAS